MTAKAPALKPVIIRYRAAGGPKNLKNFQRRTHLAATSPTITQYTYSWTTPVHVAIRVPLFITASMPTESLHENSKYPKIKPISP
jgi:hypothetical protein